MREFAGAFSGGEINRELFARLDLTRYSQSAETVRNFVATPHGPVENRSGTESVREVRNTDGITRDISWQFGLDQAFTIELGAGYFRFMALGATLLFPEPAAWSNATAYVVGDLVRSAGVDYYAVAASTNQTPASNPSYWYSLGVSGVYEVPNSYAESELFDIHYVQSNDVMTLVHPNHPPSELRRRGETFWTFDVISFVPTLLPPTSVVAVATVGAGAVTYQYVVSSLDTGTLEESDVSSVLASPTINVTGATQANPCVITAIAHGIAAGASVRPENIGGMTALNGNIYYVSSVTVDTLTLAVPTQIPLFPGTGYITVNLPLDSTGFSPYTTGGTVTSVSPTGEPLAGVGVASCTNDLTVAGNKNTVSWVAASNALRYRVYKLDNGLFGYIGQTTGLSFVDQNITPDISETPPLREAVLTSPGSYPAAVTYFEQRRLFAGTDTRPQSVIGSRSGTESSFTYHIPVRSDDRLSFKLAARSAGRLQHLVPITTLVALSPSTEWRIASTTGALAADAPPDVKPQSFIGSNNVQPIAIGTTVLFAQSRGARIRELAYSQEGGGYRPADLCVLATHLFKGTTIVDMAFTVSPIPILWCVTAHGALLGMTYEPEQQIVAWHRHDTGNGDRFESVASITERPAGSHAAEDMLYCIVRRKVGGVWRRFQERMHSRFFLRSSDAWHLDAALSNFLEGTFTQTGTVRRCVVPAHGLVTGNSANLDFDDQPTRAYTVTVIDSQTFTVAVDAGAARIGVVSVVASAPVTTLSGLGIHEGRDVAVLADGVPMPPRTVVAGMITLDAPATKVIAGLPITAELRLLPLTERTEGFGKGKLKNVNKVFLDVETSGIVQAGPNTDNLQSYRAVEIDQTPPALITDTIEIVLDNEWTVGGQVSVLHTDPTPLTIVGATREAVSGGG